MKPNIAAATGGHKKPEKGSDPLGTNTEIGRKLKQYYDELVTQDVPDRFADLLRQLESSEDKSPASKSGE
jgi:hypothetical protein